MSASQYRAELARKRKQRVDAEKKASEFRIKENSRRSDATKARTSAGRTSNASTASTKMREASRKENEANAAGKQVGEWQRKAAGFGKQEAAIQEKLDKAEQAETVAAERKRAALEKRTESAARAFQLSTSRRLDSHQEQLSAVVETIRPPKPEKLRILMLSASPEGDLRIGREAKRIQAAIRNALGRDLVELKISPAATTDDLLDGLTGFRPHVVHFSGHSNESFVYFEADEDIFEDDAADEDMSVSIPADVFARALASVDEPPLLVLFNSCNSAPQAARLVESIVPFAIGMAQEIDDGDAISYAANFYAAIANGQSIAAADGIGRVALELAGLPGSDLPTLEFAVGSDPRSTWLVTLLET
ncbi:CHAT domain-containing protein [Glaciihabitans arcticus]|uniref:CHAT domain-containing protein n=1 Tax=Glaciihabitans arcticus TaxID=2668039 RepID=A0A4Q9GSZ5_9MICO|nr:CHAT domain-containing protein [Glaciihabitans arcticus]TBN57264.1 CHAT domain-containing protein [Glaciihabitans arcticus]